MAQSGPLTLARGEHGRCAMRVLRVEDKEVKTVPISVNPRRAGQGGLQVAYWDHPLVVHAHQHEGLGLALAAVAAACMTKGLVCVLSCVQHKTGKAHMSKLMCFGKQRSTHERGIRSTAALCNLWQGPVFGMDRP
eukprot:1160423-Pelagomonas_calceolata.AAC.8